MTPYQRFEDLPVWRLAADLYDQIDDFIAQAPSRLRASFRDELERAALAVSNHIATGFERGNPTDLLEFLDAARGAAGEVRSMLIVAACRPYFAGQKPQISSLMNLTESCCRQLHSMSESLHRSGRNGHRGGENGRIVLQQRRGKRIPGQDSTSSLSIPARQRVPA
jgi:four helix bundle protein